MRNSCKSRFVIAFVLLSFAVLNAGTVSITCNTTTANVEPGSQVDYSLSVINSNRSWVLITGIAVLLPDGFTYISGSTSGSTSSNPSISNQELDWNVWSFLRNKSSFTINFSAEASSEAGTYTVYAAVVGYGFSQVTVGPTAEVTVEGNTAPLLVLNKTVDKSTGLPGEELTYTVTYVNTGDGDATEVTIYESIHETTSYITGTAEGVGMTITYSHDSGENYDSDETDPVTDLAFKLNNSLAAGGSGSVTYKVEVK